MLQIGDECDLSVADIALPSGYGVGRFEGMVIFVPGAVPGDTIRTRILRLDKRFAYGEMIRLQEPSPFRQQGSTEVCADHRECGGCELQVLAYEKQLQIKQNHLEQVLQRIGGVDLSALSLSVIVPSVDRYYYRSKIEFSIGNTGKVVGLSERMSPFRRYGGNIVPVYSCRLFSPVAEKILPLVRELLGVSGASTSRRDREADTFKRLVLREGKRTGEVMVNLIGEGAPEAHLRKRVAALADGVPDVKSVYITIAGKPVLLRGKAYIDELFGGLTLRVYPLSFFQPNPKTAERLCDRIVPLAGLGGNESILGLYCGAGTIELFLASRVSEVVGVDSSSESIVCAEENARINRIENCVFRREKVERATSRRTVGKPDILIIDPPRAGMTRQALAAVKEINTGKVVYISCNPSSLARDLKMLHPDYLPKEIVPFDFFPHTGHFEILTLLERQ